VASVLAFSFPVKEIIIACGLLIVAVIVLWMGLWYYRRRWLGEGQSPDNLTWSFADLRKMRDEGQLTEREYESLRAALMNIYGRGSSVGGSSDGKTADEQV